MKHMQSTFQAENRGLHKHAQPELKKRCAYKKNKSVSVALQQLALSIISVLVYHLQTAFFALINAKW